MKVIGLYFLVTKCNDIKYWFLQFGILHDIVKNIMVK